MNESKPNKPDKPIPEEPEGSVSEKLEFIADSIEDMFILVEKDVEANEEPREREEELRDLGRYFQHKLMHILGERVLWSAVEWLEWHKPTVAVGIHQRIKEVQKWSDAIAPDLDFPTLFAVVECLRMSCKGLELTLKNVAKPMDEPVELKDILRKLKNVHVSLVELSDKVSEEHDQWEKDADSEHSDICFKRFVKVLGELHDVQALVSATESQFISDCALLDSVGRVVEDMERCLLMAQKDRMQYSRDKESYDLQTKLGTDSDDVDQPCDGSIESLLMDDEKIGDLSISILCLESNYLREQNQSDGADALGRDDEKKRIKEPSKEAVQAYLTLKALGCTQEKAAEIMTKKLKRKKPLSQGQISKWNSSCEAWLKANNLDVFPPEMRKNVVVLDPSVVDMGARTDGRMSGDPLHKAKTDPDE